MASWPTCQHQRHGWKQVWPLGRCPNAAAHKHLALLRFVSFTQLSSTYRIGLRREQEARATDSALFAPDCVVLAFLWIICLLSTGLLSTCGCLAL